MPIRTPILLISWGSVRAATQAAGKLTNVPEKNPYNMINTTKPCQVEIPSQPNNNAPAAKTVGMSTFIGPKRSATIFGIIRPNTDAAYRQLRISEGRYIHHGQYIRLQIRRRVNLHSIQCRIKEWGIKSPES